MENNNRDFLEIIEDGNLEELKEALKIDDGLDVNRKGEAGITPLWYASFLGRKDIVEFLLKEGADVNLVDDNNYTPLMSTASNYSIAEILINANANINHVSSEGLTIFEMAVLKNNIELVNLLLAKGSDINRQDSHGNTPLMLACKKGLADVSKLLLDKGADAAIVNEKSELPNLELVGLQDYIPVEIENVRKTAPAAKFTNPNVKENVFITESHIGEHHKFDDRFNADSLSFSFLPNVIKFNLYEDCYSTLMPNLSKSVRLNSIFVPF